MNTPSSRLKLIKFNEKARFAGVFIEKHILGNRGWSSDRLRAFAGVPLYE